MRKLKQILTIAMAVMMAVVFMPILPGVNGEASATGGGSTFGGCSWNINSSGTLTIEPASNPASGYESGTLPSEANADSSWPWNNSRTSICKVVIKEGVSAGNSTAYMFSNCSNLTEINGLGNLNTANVTDMKYMFNNCSSLNKIDSLGQFDTSEVTSMNG